MDSHPAPLPPEAYFDDPRRRHHHYRSTSAIPMWGWWIIGLALLCLAAAAGYLYIGQKAVADSMPQAAVAAWWTLFSLGAVVFYFLPALITQSYGVRHRGAITTMNICLSWSLAAWIVPNFVNALPKADIHTIWALVCVTFIQWSAAMVWAIAEVERRH